MKTEHESTTQLQAHEKHPIPGTRRNRVGYLTKDKSPVSEREERHMKNEDEIDEAIDESDSTYSLEHVYSDRSVWAYRLLVIKFVARPDESLWVSLFRVAYSWILAIMCKQNVVHKTGST